MRLLAYRGKRQRKKPKPRKPELTVQQILAWADAWHERTGKWPGCKDGRIPGSLDENWNAVDAALRSGARGLPGGSSLPRLLAKRRGVRNLQQLPPLTEEQILRWADAHQQRTGCWPNSGDGLIPDTHEEKWRNIDAALSLGMRGLPGGSSLARLLAEQRGVRNSGDLSPYKVKQILAWADAYQRRHGVWPGCKSGPIPEASDETWQRVNKALTDGTRGLPGGSSLALLLEERRGKKNLRNLPPLPEEQILSWADAWHARTGTWPVRGSGPIPESPGLRWYTVNWCLVGGHRGLPGGDSLARLLARERGVVNSKELPSFVPERILQWAEAHCRRTGTWPNSKSGPILESPGDTWTKVNVALQMGLRGLPGGMTLADLLARPPDQRRPDDLPALDLDTVRDWAEVHARRTGSWPKFNSGQVEELPGLTWKLLGEALYFGWGGLPGGTTLAQLRPAREDFRKATLSEEQILAWADAYHARHGKWPSQWSGPIEGTEETWRHVSQALQRGHRGLTGESSLSKLLVKHRGVRSQTRPHLTEEQILAWADEYFREHHAWPIPTSGPIAGTEETWRSVSASLISGCRGLPGGTTLARLLEKERGVRNLGNLPALTEELILQWADAHYQRTDHWPSKNSGPIAGTSEKWSAVAGALAGGHRGLPGGSSLHQLLIKHGRKRRVIE